MRKLKNVDRREGELSDDRLARLLKKRGITTSNDLVVKNKEFGKSGIREKRWRQMLHDKVRSPQAYTGQLDVMSVVACFGGLGRSIVGRYNFSITFPRTASRYEMDKGNAFPGIAYALTSDVRPRSLIVVDQLEKAKTLYQTYVDQMTTWRNKIAQELQHQQKRQDKAISITNIPVLVLRVDKKDRLHYIGPDPALDRLLNTPLEKFLKVRLGINIKNLRLEDVFDARENPDSETGRRKIHLPNKVERRLQKTLQRTYQTEELQTRAREVYEALIVIALQHRSYRKALKKHDAKHLFAIITGCFDARDHKGFDASVKTNTGLGAMPTRRDIENTILEADRESKLKVLSVGGFHEGEKQECGAVAAYKAVNHDAPATVTDGHKHLCDHYAESVSDFAGKFPKSKFLEDKTNSQVARVFGILNGKYKFFHVLLENARMDNHPKPELQRAANRLLYRVVNGEVSVITMGVDTTKSARDEKVIRPIQADKDLAQQVWEGWSAEERMQFINL